MALASSRQGPYRPAWRPSSAQARTLAASLRRRRLTVLLDDDRESMSSLLAAGVLPLLGRRSEDGSPRTVSDLDKVVLPFPERRQRPQEARTEILVLFDAERERSVQLLESRFEASVRAAGGPSTGVGRCLADHVENLSATHRLRFLFILDGFRAVLPTTGAPNSTQQALIDELVELLNRPLPVNVLLAATSTCWRHATPFTARLHDVETVVMPLAEYPSAPGAARPTLTLQKTAAAVEVRPPSIVRAPVLDFPVRQEPGPASSLPPSEHAQPATEPLGSTPSTAGRRSAIAVACALLVAAAVGVWWARQQVDAPRPVAVVDSPAAKTTTRIASSPVIHAVTQAPVFVSPPAATLVLAVDGEGHLSPRMLAELARALGAQGQEAVETRVVLPVSARLASASSAAMQLAVASYDDLQSRGDTERTAPLQVLAPLGTETIDILVRGDSPLHFLHEIEGKRINVGPVGSSGALTGGLLYRRMFGANLPPGHALGADASAAVQQLLHGQEVDAVLTLGEQARSILAGLPESDRRSLRSLVLQRNQVATRRAMQAYLPVDMAGADGTTVPGLGSMNFLVATGKVDAPAAKRLDRLADTLCHQLGGLQRQGDAAWRDVQAGLQPPIAIRQVDTRVIDTAWAACRSGGSQALDTPR